MSAVESVKNGDTCIINEFGYTSHLMRVNDRWVMHREDGPALESESRDIMVWYLNGQPYYKETQFLKALQVYLVKRKVDLF